MRTATHVLLALAAGASLAYCASDPHSAGDKCSGRSDCVTNLCFNGACECSTDGGPCATDVDCCSTDLACRNSTCLPIPKSSCIPSGAHSSLALPSGAGNPAQPVGTYPDSECCTGLATPSDFELVCCSPSGAAASDPSQCCSGMAAVDINGRPTACR